MKPRKAQKAALEKLPARDLARGLFFAWDHLSSVEDNEERSQEERDIATHALNALVGRMGIGKG